MSRSSPAQLLYRRLAAEARRLALLFDSGAAALERVAADAAGPRAHAPAAACDALGDAAAAAAPPPPQPAQLPRSVSAAAGSSAGSAEAITQRLRCWTEGRPLERRPGPSCASPTAFDAWLTGAVTRAVSEPGAACEADAWMPRSRAARDSDGTGWSYVSASAGDAEKRVANAVAALLRLPPRFHWPLSSAPAPPNTTNPVTTAAPLTAASPLATTSSAHPAAPAQASLMLWPTGMRTTSGSIAARPPEASATTAIASSAPLTALPAVVSAAQLFASTKTTSSPSAAALSAVSAPPRSSMRSRGGAPGGLTDGGGCGGGALYPSMLEAYAVLLHTARTQAITRGAGQTNAFAGSEATQQQRQRLVLYCSDQCDALLVRAAQLIGIPHVRVLQTVAMQHQLPLPRPREAHDAEARDTCAVYTYALDVRQVQARLVEDVAAGLYPLLVVGTFGAALSGSVDPIAALAAACQRLGVWFHLDASHGGTALLAQAGHGGGGGGGGGGASLIPSCAALQAQFRAAAALADSVVVPAGHSSALPYAPLSSCVDGYGDSGADGGAAALFLADMRKLAWSVQALDVARHLSMNQFVTPRVCDSDVLRVTPLAHTARWLQRLRTSAMLMPTDALARRVAAHQALAQSVLQAVRGDGRFDAALDAAAFGLVHLRWLTAADEATERLAEAWRRVMAGGEAGDVAARAAKQASTSHATPPPVQVHVRLVQLQRRLWVVVSFGAVSCEDGADISADLLAYVLRTLDAAASVVEPSTTAGTAFRPVPAVPHD